MNRRPLHAVLFLTKRCATSLMTSENARIKKESSCETTWCAGRGTGRGTQSSKFRKAWYQVRSSGDARGSGRDFYRFSTLSDTLSDTLLYGLDVASSHAPRSGDSRRYTDVRAPDQITRTFQKP